MKEYEIASLTLAMTENRLPTTKKRLAMITNRSFIKPMLTVNARNAFFRHCEVVKRPKQSRNGMGLLRLARNDKMLTSLVFILLFNIVCFLNISKAAVFEKVSTNELENNNNLDSWSMAVFKNYLYVGTQNSFSGAGIWRTSNGTNWSQVNADGFENDNANESVNAMAVFKGFLYAGTWNGLGAQIWRTRNGTEWSEVNIGGDGFGDSNNTEIDSLCVFNNRLYAGTWNSVDGGEIWCTSDGTNWSQVNVDDFGDNAWDNDNVSAWSMAVFGGYLYAGTQNDSTGTQIWRTRNGTEWSMVDIGGDGFGDANNVSISTFGVYKGSLYAGTWNDNTTGAEVWRTSNGTTWEQVNEDGFDISGTVGAWSMAADRRQLYAGTWNESSGAGLFNYPIEGSWNNLVDDGFGNTANKSIDSMAIFKGNLYAGLWNPSTGTEVWRYNIDYSKPRGRVKINNGDRTVPQNVDVTLNINADDNDGTGVEEMMVSNFSDFQGASWEGYATTKSWTLKAGVGRRRVFIKFRDMAGNVSRLASDSIRVVE